ncbi:MAG TPA: hypothetical protein VF458_02420 [Ktedonobacteraceae bacterium]
MVEHSALEEFLVKAATASAVNGATIVDATGSVLAGTSGTVVQGTSLNGYRHLAITVKNKPGSVSPLTFTFQEINQGIGGSNTVTLAVLRMSVGNTGYAYVATALAGLSDSLTITVSADAGAGEDNFHVTVSGYTS